VKLSYLPPLMVYAAYGVSGLTGIVGTFFVKEYLVELSPAFLAALLFWAGIPWAVKMPVGHLVDLIWRWKALLVWLGAAMIAASLLIMIGLISHFDAMRALMSGERWFVIPNPMYGSWQRALGPDPDTALAQPPTPFACGDTG